jgi:hypothetical protein
MTYREPTVLESLELFCQGPSAIDAQEKRGQKSLAQNEQLPIDGSESEAAKASPISWGKKVDGLFREATLPSGWKKSPTSHAMWTDLLDSRGCPRASIFWKAAFYDQNAAFYLLCRYRVEAEYQDGKVVAFCVWDQGQGPEKVALYRETPTLPGKKEESLQYYEAIEAETRKAVAWLAESYPAYKDPNAYWDE